MKAKIIDTNSTDSLEKEINEFIKDKQNVNIIPQLNSGGIGAVIVYDKPSTIQQKAFDECTDDDEINEFMKNHDVIKVEHFGENFEEVKTIITYREKNND